MSRTDVTEAWTLGGVIDARNAAAALLDRLGLEGYVFEIEPMARDDLWEIRLEWVRGGPDGKWTTTRFEIDGTWLLRSLHDEATRACVLRGWGDVIAAAGDTAK